MSDVRLPDRDKKLGETHARELPSDSHTWSEGSERRLRPRAPAARSSVGSYDSGAFSKALMSNSRIPCPAPSTGPSIESWNAMVLPFGLTAGLDA
jgi:hypothetical protein